MSKQVTEQDLFYPSSNKDIRQEYSELMGVKEFEGLKTDELKFCWYAGCFFADDKEVWKKSLDQSGLGKSLKQKDYNLYVSGNCPSNIKNAVTRFKSFNISSRLEAKFITENILANYRVLSSTDVKDVGLITIYDDEGVRAIGEKRDWNQVNAFVTAMGKIVDELPGLIQKTEEGYGLKLGFNDVSIGRNIRDDYVNRQSNEKK